MLFGNLEEIYHVTYKKKILKKLWLVEITKKIGKDYFLLIFYPNVLWKLRDFVDFYQFVYILKILLKSINVITTYKRLKMMEIFFYNKLKN